MGLVNLMRHTFPEAIPLPGAIIYNAIPAKILRGPEKRIAQEVLNRIESGILIDLGSGTGYLAIEIAKMAPELQVYGIDLSKTMVKIARKHAQTVSNVQLVAEYEDGSITEGEALIPNKKLKIKKVFLKPENAKATEDALAAIGQADVIILGPGSLFTSILPNLVIKELSEKIASAKNAFKIYVCNVMTQPGETDGFSANDHLKAIVEQCYWAEGIKHYADWSFKNTNVVQDWIDYGVVVEPINPSIEDALVAAASEYYAERAAEDAFFAKVLKSLEDWRDAYKSAYPRL